MKLKEIIQIFFKTGTDLNYTGEKNVAMLLGATKPSTDGKVVEYVIDMTENKLWGGYITGIRVDPFNNQGIFKIDYVRFSK
ncbi:MAG: hypothetical protein RSA24_05955 [Clostridia bacterium]